MKALGHGANVAEMAKVYGKREEEIIDFSSNINPFISEALEPRLVSALQAARSYPDIYYTELRQRIAAYLQCDMELIIPGNGATEIMYLLMKGLSLMAKEEGRNFRLGILNPTFSEYERSARLNDFEIIDLYWERQEEIGKAPTFKIKKEEILEKIDEIDGLFICNPNNPTGNVQDLQEIADILDQHNKWLIIDETFMEFVEQESFYSLAGEVWRYDRMVVIKAVTKFFGLPGLRLGYGIISHQALLEKMYEHKEPWTINSFAEVLTKAMLQDRSYIEESKAYFLQEKARMDGMLRNISGITVYRTDTNFILLRLHDMASSELKEKLMIEHNILIRDASNFKGLDEKFVRIAIKSAEENNRLVEALEQYIR